MSEIKLHTLDEAAEILRTHRESVRQMIVEGEIQGTPMGRGTKRRKWLVSDDALRRFIANREESAKPQPKRKRASAPMPKQWV
ncbi:Helix-turn-helix domain protein [Stieleria maiorica]|uniref:Helix-turn-helix domain protein n=1 Tax=Stieleria maiorica TaxID=2795974 RepID=A0A5B9MLE5_9BACT|nr:helix-turn-helix domain-containing protein [Stieleria maiorica]QEF99757.1 Helix-turn-helix domain protein [Stieleria maiorica]